jgi:beta-glucosidase-like glycosyl hydrolase
MVIVMMILSVSVMAQKPFAGNITFEMSAEGCSNPNIAAELAEQSMEYTVMGNNYRMEMSQGIDVVTIANGTNKTYTVILGIPGYGKYFIQQSEEDINKKMATTKFDYNYTEEEKTISGYKCKKVVVTATDLETDEEETAVLWVTNELGLGDEINFFEHPGLKGYPLATEVKTEMDGENVTLITQATKIVPNKKVKATMFMLPSDAKDIKEAPDELKQMLHLDEDGEE